MIARCRRGVAAHLALSESLERGTAAGPKALFVAHVLSCDGCLMWYETKHPGTVKAMVTWTERRKAQT